MVTENSPARAEERSGPGPDGGKEHWSNNYQHCTESLNQWETNALQMHKFCGFDGILHP